MRPVVLRRLGALVVMLGLLATFAATPVLAASIIVTSLADTAADDGACTLREAITAANDNIASGASLGECAAGSVADSDVISFSGSGTITLTSLLPAIASNLSIDGAGAITISGDLTYQVLAITAGTVGLTGLTITEGFAEFENGFLGGGVINDGTLSITNSTVTGNMADFVAGGINNSGTLSITNSTISGNSADSFGGGMANTGTLNVTNSTINGNSGGDSGGVINSGGTLNVTNSTISGNSATGTGGIDNSGTLNVTNSTISGNSATFTGGILAGGTETLVNAIVAGNTAVFSPAGADIAGPVEGTTANLIGVPVGKTLADILDPDGLADNGGPTQTIALALVAGNPAIDTGDALTCAAAPVSALDQRGLPRPAACDIGAYEAQPPTVAAHANVSAPATSAAGAAVSYTLPAGSDEQGGAAAVACLPASGASFPVGSTTVTCTATDAVGHTASGTFQVSVGTFATAAPTATPRLLPNTAVGAGAAGSTGFALAIAALGLVSLALLAPATRKSRRR